MCEAYSMPPDVAERQDYDLVHRMLFARAAKQAFGKFERKDKMTNDETALLNVLHDALDDRDDIAGIEPEA